jgi:hypothetical protein
MFEILLLVAFLISYYVWQKEKNNYELYYLRLYGAGVLALIWEHVAKDVVHLSGAAELINRYFILLFWLAAGIVWVSLTIKSSINKK